MESSNTIEQLPVNTWPAGVYLILLVVLLLFAYVFGRYKEQTTKMLSAAIIPRSKSILERSDSESIARVGVFLNLIFLLNFMLLIWLTIEEVKQENVGLKQTGYILEAILLFFGLKYLFQKLLGSVFKTAAETKLLLQDTYLKYRLFGVLVFPLLLLALFSNQYTEWYVLLSFLLFFILYTAKSFFGLRLGLLSKSFPKHYSFLYICTLEILPLLVIGKLFWLPFARLLGFL